MDGWPPPWKRVMRFLQSFLGVELVNSPANWCKGWGTWDTLTAGIIWKWSALIIQWPLIKIESNANVGIIYLVSLSCLTCVGHAYLFLKKEKKNIKNFCHQINDDRIWHWYIVRCLVICKFYLRLIITKINSPPVSLSKLSLCVGIATLKKKNSAWAQWLTIRSLWVCCLRSLSLLLNLKYLNLSNKIFHCRLLCGL